MGKTLYHCPLCNKQSGYISEYGMQDSVICKCQGLNEVGRLVSGKYVPNATKQATPSPIANPAPQPQGVASNGQPYVYGRNPVLPQGNGNRPGIQGNALSIQAGSFTIYHLSLETEIEAAGRYFNNALSSDAGRQRFMGLGHIYYAEHSTDENRSLMFYIDKATGEAVNFYGKQNRSCAPQDVDQVKYALRQQNLIKN